MEVILNDLQRHLGNFFFKKIQKPQSEPCTKQRQNEDGKKCHLSKFDFITQ